MFRPTVIGCFFAFFVGWHPPVQWGEFVVVGEHVKVDNYKEPVRYKVLADSRKRGRREPILVIEISPAFAGPYGFSHEAAHAGAESAARIDISGGGGETTSVLISFNRERSDQPQTASVNSEQFEFALGETISVSLAASGDVKMIDN